MLEVFCFRIGRRKIKPWRSVSDRLVPSAAEKLEKKRTVQLDASTVEIEERGVKLRLTVVDTPGFGDAIDNTDSFQQIIRYIDDQFERCVSA